tara:strand:- start:1180 stop:2160 length:981 start_codon:yes stop_codon:yes gene_type:complete
MNSKILISIVNTSNAKYLKKCLISIYERNKEENFDICVLDNASDDNSLSMLKEEFPEVIVLKNKTKLGYIENQNIILNKLYKNYHYIMLLNEDTEMITYSFLNKMKKSLDSDSGIAAISPKIYYADGSIQPGGNGFTTVLIYIFKIMKLTKIVKWLRIKSILVKFRKFIPHKQIRMYLRKFSKSYSALQISPVISGCCIIIKKQALDDVGLLDDRFIMYADDLDWCRRASIKGWSCYYDNNVELMHHYKASFSEFTYIEEHRSMFRYLRKYKHSKIGIVFLKIISLLESIIIIVSSFTKILFPSKKIIIARYLATELKKIKITFTE